MFKLFAAIILVLVGIYVLVMPQTTTVDISHAGLLAEINKSRAKHNAPPVVIDQTLQSASQRRADLLCGQPFNHEQYLPQLNASGYPYKHANENLAEKYRTNKEIVTAWENSPDHFAAMIDPKFNEAGIGIADCEDGYVIVNWLGIR